MTYIPLLRTLLYCRSGLHWWQLAVRLTYAVFIGAKGSPRILLASPTSALRAFTPSPSWYSFSVQLR